MDHVELFDPLIVVAPNTHCTDGSKSNWNTLNFSTLFFYIYQHCLCGTSARRGFQYLHVGMYDRGLASLPMYVDIYSVALFGLGAQ